MDGNHRIIREIRNFKLKQKRICLELDEINDLRNEKIRIQLNKQMIIPSKEINPPAIDFSVT